MISTTQRAARSPLLTKKRGRNLFRKFVITGVYILLCISAYSYVLIQKYASTFAPMLVTRTHTHRYIRTHARYTLFCSVHLLFAVCLALKMLCTGNSATLKYTNTQTQMFMCCMCETEGGTVA